MTRMKKLALGAALTALTVGGVMATTTAPADARVVVGIGFGVPWVYPAYPAYYPPCYYGYCGYPAAYYGYPGYYGGGWGWVGGRWVWRGGFRDRDDFRFRDRDGGFHGDRGFHAGAMHGR